MRAILLAAGRGRRLGIDGPKCLVRVRGRTLLERHLDAMERAGLDALTIVVGHGRLELERELAAIVEARRAAGRPVGLAIECLFNELYPHGSLVSLCRAGQRLAEGGLWMDADVLYPAELLAKLVRSRHPNAVLLDARASETGEEMMLAVDAGRVAKIARRVGPGWELAGESVGFFKVDAAGGAALRAVLEREVHEGRLDQEHEDGLNRLLPLVPFGYELVGELAWTEIDFPEDVAKAERIAEALDVG
jgi:choline kinase